MLYQLRIPTLQP